jgi:hypothetical protein
VISLLALKYRISCTRPGNDCICHYHDPSDHRAGFGSTQGARPRATSPSTLPRASLSIRRARQWITRLPCTKTTQLARLPGGRRQLLPPSIRERALSQPLAMVLRLQPRSAPSRAPQAMRTRIQWEQIVATSRCQAPCLTLSAQEIITDRAPWMVAKPVLRNSSNSGDRCQHHKRDRRHHETNRQDGKRRSHRALSTSSRPRSPV